MAVSKTEQTRDTARNYLIPLSGASLASAVAAAGLVFNQINELCGESVNEPAMAAVAGLVLGAISLGYERTRVNSLDSLDTKTATVAAGVGGAAALALSLMKFNDTCSTSESTSTATSLMLFAVVTKAVVAIAHAFVPVMDTPGLFAFVQAKNQPGGYVQPHHMRAPVSVQANKFATPAAASLGRTRSTSVRSNKQRMMASLRSDAENMMRNAAAGLAAAGIAANTFVAGAPAAHALTKDEMNQLSYLQVKGTGVANRCVEVGGAGEGKVSVSGSQEIVDLCMEPKAFFVQEEPGQDFTVTKLMTRQTYTLDGVSGDVSSQGGNINIQLKDGIDYAATTVQLPSGDRVPFLFSIKELKAQGKGDAFVPGYKFGGVMKVPEYRTGLFLDPKGRGSSTGYDMAVALPGLQNGVEGDAELFNENNKKFQIKEGEAEFTVTKVDPSTGEIGGTFVSQQPSDTDLGSKKAKTILLKGIWYARIE